MSEFKTIPIGKERTFVSVDSLKTFISEKVPTTPDMPTSSDIKSVEFGYLEPGHGAKGKKVWIFKDEDVAAMYETHSGRKCVRLWCYTHVRTASASVTKSGSGPKFEQYTEKLSEVDEISAKLYEKHKGKYSKDQLRAWAHMIRMGKYDSYDEAPDKPFWQGRKRSSSDNHSQCPDRKRCPGSSVSSPSKKVGIRSELISQLQTWHTLLASGAVSQSDYDELKSTILTDIKDLQK